MITVFINSATVALPLLLMLALAAGAVRQAFEKTKVAAMSPSERKTYLAEQAKANASRETTRQAVAATRQAAALERERIRQMSKQARLLSCGLAMRP
jgi:uncharacterized protein HemX